MTLLYTNIYHNFRRKNGLTLNEYVLCDMVFYLCKRSDSKVAGWCYMSKDTMAKELDMTKQGLLKLIKKVVEMGYLEKQEITAFLRTTPNWEQVYFDNGKQSLPMDDFISDVGKQSLLELGEQSLPNNISINNNSNKEKQILFSESFYNNYENLKSTLAKDEEFKKKYAYVDLKHYIEDCLLWSDSKNQKRTERGWLATLRNFMKGDLEKGELKKLEIKKEQGHTNH